MKNYTSDNIRNIAVAGHAGRGKTTLCEAMLYVAGATERLGKVADGTTVMDFDAEEKKRGASLMSAVASLEWKNNHNAVVKLYPWTILGFLCAKLQ